MLDKVFKRYSDITFIFNLPVDMTIDLIFKAVEEEMNDRLWEKWLHDSASGMSFDQYVQQHQPQATKSEEQVLQDAEDILKMMSRK